MVKATDAGFHSFAPAGAHTDMASHRQADDAGFFDNRAQHVRVEHEVNFERVNALRFQGADERRGSFGPTQLNVNIRVIAIQPVNQRPAGVDVRPFEQAQRHGFLEIHAHRDGDARIAYLCDAAHQQSAAVEGAPIVIMIVHQAGHDGLTGSV